MGSQAQSKQNLSSQHSRQADIAQKKPSATVHQEAPGQGRPIGDLAALRPDLIQPQDLTRLQRAAGNRAAATLVQAKLVLSPAGDTYENEADRIAEQVMSPHSSQLAPRVSPFAASGGTAGIEVNGDLESRLRAGQAGGAPLAANVRRQMEERFHSDFRDVRLHTDSLAAQLNLELRARAFTHGRDIFLGHKAADPTTPAGQRLLAHELTHVIQQTGASAAASAAGAPIQCLRPSEDPDVLRRLRARRMDIDPEDTETIADYNERLSTLNPANQAFMQRQIQARNQEVFNVGARREAARNRQSNWLESDWTNMATSYTGYLGAGLSLGGSISGTVNAFDANNAASGYAGSGLGIAGSAVSGVASGFQFAGGLSKISRAARLMKSKSRAAQMLGKDLRSEGYQSSVESGLGVLGGLTGIGTNVSGIFTTADSNNTAADVSNKTLGTIGAGIGIASEGASLFGAGRKMMGASERKEAADAFFKQSHDIELAEIAKNTGKSQKSKGSLFGNIFKSALNVGSNILGVASAFSGGDTKAYLSLASTITGGAGAVSGGIQTEYERFSGMASKKRAEADSGKLLGKIQAGDAGAIKFAVDVLKIPEAGKLAEEDPESLKELLSGRMTQFSA
jgi:hypothetical protein